MVIPYMRKIMLCFTTSDKEVNLSLLGLSLRIRQKHDNIFLKGLLKVDSWVL